MARKLSLEERAKIRLGYFWDWLPEEAREKARQEIRAAAEKETRQKMPERKTKSVFKG